MFPLSGGTCNEKKGINGDNDYKKRITFTKRYMTPLSCDISAKKASLRKFKPSPKGFRLTDTFLVRCSTSLATWRTKKIIRDKEISVLLLSCSGF